jgi:hypothetical protein
LHNARQSNFRTSVLVALKASFPLFTSISVGSRATLQNGTLTATGAFVKNILLLCTVLVLLAAAAGCSKSDSTSENPDANTNAAPQNAKESASNAWQDTKGAATNAWNATKDEATNVWNKTTNAIH